MWPDKMPNFFVFLLVSGKKKKICDMIEMRYLKWAKRLKQNCNFSDDNENDRHRIFYDSQCYILIYFKRLSMENSRIIGCSSRISWKRWKRWRESHTYKDKNAKLWYDFASLQYILLSRVWFLLLFVCSPLLQTFFHFSYILTKHELQTFERVKIFA